MLFENCKLLQRFLILIFNSKETKANFATALKKRNQIVLLIAELDFVSDHFSPHELTRSLSWVKIQ